MAFASALTRAFDVLSIATFEANPLALICERGHQQLFDATKGVAAEFEAAFNEGEGDAPSRIIDFLGGCGSFDAMPDSVQEFCRKTSFTNVLDWHTAFKLNARMSDYAALSVPVLLARGTHANIQMIEITESLKTCVPNNNSALIKGASHSLITSHSKECANLLSEFLKIKM